MKVQIYPNLYIGDEAAFEEIKPTLEKWTVVHACKEPFHRLLLGYMGRSAPTDHAEYLLAERGEVLYLNLVDANDPKYISDKIIDPTLKWIAKKYKENKTILIHCNKGESRAPSIGLLYMASVGALTGTVPEIIDKFKKIYPYYNPGIGMRIYTQVKILKLQVEDSAPDISTS